MKKKEKKKKWSLEGRASLELALKDITMCEMLPVNKVIKYNW